MGLFDALVSVPGDLSSGPVPRELKKGVLWDAKAETKFIGYVGDFLNSRLKLSLVDAVREAKWAVESWLYRQMWFREIRAASTCESPAEKQRLVKDWIARYGREQAQRFADAFLNKKFVTVALSWGDK